MSSGKNSDRHSNLVDVLTTTPANPGSSTQNPRRSSGDDESCQESEFSPGSAFWRRSYNCKRRGNSSITSSTFTNRERPKELDVHAPKPWRQRFEELLTDNERPNGRTAHSASSSELDSLCYPRPSPQQDFTSPTSIHAGNVDKPVECSPIFAKTFPRRDTARIASVSDLDQYRASSTASVNQEQQARAPPVEMKRSVWREQRRIRANSLLTDVGENGATSANDLNELLEILKIENGSNAAIRRRVSKLKLMSSESGDESSDHQKTTPLLSPMPEVPAKTDIDEVVRHCEQVWL